MNNSKNVLHKDAHKWNLQVGHYQWFASQRNISLSVMIETHAKHIIAWQDWKQCTYACVTFMSEIHTSTTRLHPALKATPAHQAQKRNKIINK